MRFVCRSTNLALRAGLALVLALASGIAAAQSYPARAIRLIVPFPAGGGSDIVSRLVMAQVAERLGQPIVVENRGGAAGNIGMEAGAKAAPDGYTLTVVTQNGAVNPHLYPKLGFDPLKDFAPVALMTRFYQIVVVHPSVPANTMAELVTLAKARPGRITGGNGGVGGTSHMDIALLNAMAGIDIVQVPYKGEAPVMADLLAGNIALTISSFAGIDQHLKAGKLRALGVTSPTRSRHFPDVPAIAETIPGYEMDGWYGVAAPAGTPPGVIELLAKEIVSALGREDLRQRIVERGFDVAALGPAEFGRVLRADHAKYGKLIRDAGIKAGD